VLIKCYVDLILELRSQLCKSYTPGTPDSFRRYTYFLAFPDLSDDNEQLSWFKSFAKGLYGQLSSIPCLPLFGKDPCVLGVDAVFMAPVQALWDPFIGGKQALSWLTAVQQHPKLRGALMSIFPDEWNDRITGKEIYHQVSGKNFNDLDPKSGLLKVKEHQRKRRTNKLGTKGYNNAPIYNEGDKKLYEKQPDKKTERALRRWNMVRLLSRIYAESKKHTGDWEFTSSAVAPFEHSTIRRIFVRDGIKIIDAPMTMLKAFESCTHAMAAGRNVCSPSQARSFYRDKWKAATAGKLPGECRFPLAIAPKTSEGPVDPAWDGVETLKSKSSLEMLATFFFSDIVNSRDWSVDFTGVPVVLLANGQLSAFDKNTKLFIMEPRQAQLFPLGGHLFVNSAEVPDRFKENEQQAEEQIGLYKIKDIADLGELLDKGGALPKKWQGKPFADDVSLDDVFIEGAIDDEEAASDETKSGGDGKIHSLLKGFKGFGYLVSSKGPAGAEEEKMAEAAGDNEGDGVGDIDASEAISYRIWLSRFYQEVLTLKNNTPTAAQFEAAFDWPIIPATDGKLYRPSEGKLAGFLPSSVLDNPNEYVQLCLEKLNLPVIDGNIVVRACDGVHQCAVQKADAALYVKCMHYHARLRNRRLREAQSRSSDESENYSHENMKLMFAGAEMTDADIRVLAEGLFTALQNSDIVNSGEAEALFKMVCALPIHETVEGNFVQITIPCSKWKVLGFDKEVLREHNAKTPNLLRAGGATKEKTQSIIDFYARMGIQVKKKGTFFREEVLSELGTKEYEDVRTIMTYVRDELTELKEADLPGEFEKQLERTPFIKHPGFEKGLFPASNFYIPQDEADRRLVETFLPRRTLPQEFTDTKWLDFVKQLKIQENLSGEVLVECARAAAKPIYQEDPHVRAEFLNNMDCDDEACLVVNPNDQLAGYRVLLDAIQKNEQHLRDQDWETLKTLNFIPVSEVVTAQDAESLGIPPVLLRPGLGEPEFAPLGQSGDTAIRSNDVSILVNDHGGATLHLSSPKHVLREEEARLCFTKRGCFHVQLYQFNNQQLDNVVLVLKHHAGMEEKAPFTDVVSHVRHMALHVLNRVLSMDERPERGRLTKMYLDSLKALNVGLGDALAKDNHDILRDLLTTNSNGTRVREQAKVQAGCGAFLSVFAKGESTARRSPLTVADASDFMPFVLFGSNLTSPGRIFRNLDIDIAPHGFDLRGDRNLDKLGDLWDATSVAQKPSEQLLLDAIDHVLQKYPNDFVTVSAEDVKLFVNLIAGLHDGSFFFERDGRFVKDRIPELRVPCVRGDYVERVSTQRYGGGDVQPRDDECVMKPLREVAREVDSNWYFRNALLDFPRVYFLHPMFQKTIFEGAKNCLGALPLGSLIESKVVDNADTTPVDPPNGMEDCKCSLVFIFLTRLGIHKILFPFVCACSELHNWQQCQGWSVCSGYCSPRRDASAKTREQENYNAWWRSGRGKRRRLRRI
jgi:hypothetical protein